MVCWRRRQPEPQARRLLGREPARLVPAHQGAADLRVHKQPVQSQIRDLRDLLRSAVDGRDRDTKRAVRPPHGHAGAAALGLFGNAREVVNASRVPLVLIPTSLTRRYVSTHAAALSFETRTAAVPRAREALSPAMT